MTQAELRGVMKFHLRNFNDEGVKIGNETVLDTVLSDSDGFGASNSKALFKGSIRWTLWHHDQSDPRWPAGWMALTVEALAAKLLPEE